MKHPILLATCLLASVPALAQPAPALEPPPVVGGPIQLRNPNRRGDGNGSMSAQPRPNARLLQENFYQDAPAPPAVSMFADERYLFILRGDTLMQFDKRSLTLLKTIEIPSRSFPTASLVPPQSRFPEGTTVYVPVSPHVAPHVAPHVTPHVAPHVEPHAPYVPPKPEPEPDKPEPEGQPRARTSPPLVKGK